MKPLVRWLGLLLLSWIVLASCTESNLHTSSADGFEQARILEDTSTTIGSKSQFPVQLGMEKELLVAMVPIDSSIPVDSDLWQLEGILGDIPGRWTISFSNDQVSWFAFSSFDHQINEDEFIHTLSRTQEVVELYSLFLGSPRRIISGITQFKDPTTHQHQGYQVYQALWEENGSRIVIDFSFVGEGRDYGFLVTVQGS